jgi:ABC-type branched-subunit amino acid transport system substrate-binding protein
MSENKSFFASKWNVYLVLWALFLLQTSDCFCQGNNTDPSGNNSKFTGAMQLYKNGDFEPAAVTFRQLALDPKIHPYTTASFLMAAKSLLQLESCPQAIELLDSLIAKFPETKYITDARYTIGLCEIDEKKYGEATSDLYDAMQRAGKSPLATKADSLVRFLALERLSKDDLSSSSVLASNRNAMDYVALIIAGEDYQHGNLSAARETLQPVKERIDSKYKVDAETLLAKIDKGVSIKIGVLLPLSDSIPDPERAIAHDMMDGISFALQHRQGSFPPGVGVELEVKDSERDSVIARQSITELGTDQNVVAVIGPLFSSTVIACAPVTSEMSLPLLSPTANSRDITANGKYIFQLNPSSVLNGSAMAEYAVSKLHLKTFAILAEDDSSARAMAEGFYKKARSLGARITDVELYSGGATDLDDQCIHLRQTALNGEPRVSFAGKWKIDQLQGLLQQGVPQKSIDSLRRAKASIGLFKLLGMYGEEIADSLNLKVDYGARRGRDVNDPLTELDGLFAPIGDGDEIGVVASQLAYFNIKAKLLGNAEWYSLSALEPNRQYTDGVTFCSDTYIDDDDPKVKEFGTSFFAQSGKSPSKYTMYGYDAMNLILRMIADGATTRQAIAAAASGMKNVHGLHTTFSFDERRTNAHFDVLKYHNNAIVKIGEVIVR